MAKRQTQFVCQACGRTTPVYMGRCPRCGEFDTMVEQRVETEPSAGGRRVPGAALSRPVRLREVEADGLDRLALPVAEFSRVLGGGLVPGSLILVGGDPGIGKSTLLLEIAGQVAGLHGPVLYISGEESARQIKMRADRLKLDAEDLFLVTETSLHTMLDHITAVRPIMVIVDSIQTTYDENMTSSAGSVSQVRESAARFQDVAKQTGVIIVLVGHVTKEGAIAGPRVLEHIVDTVLYLEGDPFHRYRLLRSVKNRFGATSEVGVFEMVEQGMVEVTNPSEAFLAERQANSPGSAIVVTLEGTRPLLVEVQALAAATTFTNPRRTPNGIDYNRLLLLTAVLTRRALAIASSVKDRAIHADMAFFGEVGLSGELRAVSQLEPRLREAAKLGFRRCVVPRSRQLKDSNRFEGLEIIQCRTLHEAVETALIK